MEVWSLVKGGFLCTSTVVSSMCNALYTHPVPPSMCELCFHSCE